ncbi:MAG: class I SAM-dependent methyltransferase [Flavobacteriales bacterium]
MGWFTHWFGTRYYSLLYGHRDEQDAGAWVDMINRRWDLPHGAELMDLACGRGRHAKHFASTGLRVTGIDISEVSIGEARCAVPGTEFRVHDMRVPFATGRFDGICCLFTSLGYFDTLDDDRKVFAAVVEALKPGGRFMLDFMNTELVLRDLVPAERLELEGVVFRIERELVDDVIVKRVSVIDRGTEHRFEERVQALTPEQLERMAVDAGLIIEDRTDGPDPLPFDRQRSQRFVLWTRKPEVP